MPIIVWLNRLKTCSKIPAIFFAFLFASFINSAGAFQRTQSDAGVYLNLVPPTYCIDAEDALLRQQYDGDLGLSPEEVVSYHRETLRDVNTLCLSFLNYKSFSDETARNQACESLARTAVALDQYFEYSITLYLPEVQESLRALYYKNYQNQSRWNPYAASNFVAQQKHLAKAKVGVVHTKFFEGNPVPATLNTNIKHFTEGQLGFTVAYDHDLNRTPLLKRMAFIREIAGIIGSYQSYLVALGPEALDADYFRNDGTITIREFAEIHAERLVDEAILLVSNLGKGVAAEMAMLPKKSYLRTFAKGLDAYFSESSAKVAAVGRGLFVESKNQGPAWFAKDILKACALQYPAEEEDSQNVSVSTD